MEAKTLSIPGKTGPMPALDLNLPHASEAKPSASVANPNEARADDFDITDSLLTPDGQYLQINHVDRMPPFLMSVVSDSDFWLFIGSNGGFTAGRVDPDHAVFPYRTVDKILAQPKASGTMCLIACDGIIWEPWAMDCPTPGIQRNLYKHVTGTSVVFEEIHLWLGLVMRCELSASERLGLVRRCHLENLREYRRDIRMLDGWHHILPPGVSQEAYARYSYLAAAYMRHEAVPGSGLGIYTLNCGITDRAEPCESLYAACAWSHGLDDATLLLSDRQVAAFRQGGEIVAEREVRGAFGAYLLSTEFTLGPGASRQWHVVVDTGMDHTSVSRLRYRLAHPEGLGRDLEADFVQGVQALEKRVAGAGAIQQTADRRTCVHHFANVLFNCMRGGTLHDNYSFQCSDFRAFIKTRNSEIHQKHAAWLQSLPETVSLYELRELAGTCGDPQLMRLAGEYLPICFSRRHGDPSRPWNRFEIHTKDGDGLPLFTYAGNWRDIFQNWESLAYSYPQCFEPMISIFLNASTADGYNPYRITRAGIDWEVFDPADPWSHIGYWGDHQIIYLLRLLEGMEHFDPGKLGARLNDRCHAYANVPYEIRSLEDLLADPKHSIHFNGPLHAQLMDRTRRIGGDGKLLTDAQGQIVLVTLVEKLLVPLLVKLGNLVPGGGIWLNTQRPEWNDANNALAGWGLSVVTVCYMRRYLVFLEEIIAGNTAAHFDLTKPVADFLDDLTPILPRAARVTDDKTRLDVLMSLGRAGEKHRRAVYQNSTSDTVPVETTRVRQLIHNALAAVDATLKANRRKDHLYHSYNILEVADENARVHHLELMLEGQVAALSSRLLDPRGALRLASALRHSALHRKDQNSYLLYPDREVVPFLERNTLPQDWMTRVPNLSAVVQAGDRRIIQLDDDMRSHFHAELTNMRDLQARLDRLADDPTLAEAISKDRDQLALLWEEVFNHKSFTGRSGAMFAFEGLGSIYWHMVAKLLLAVQEVFLASWDMNPDSAETCQLAIIYHEIRSGLGFTKSAATYGAFPTDPYSHTPRDYGAQQPGMTGQVKEEILTRLGELGVHVRNGEIHFEPALLGSSEFHKDAHNFRYYDLEGLPAGWPLGPGTLAFTLCQVPVCYELSDHSSITLEMHDGSRMEMRQSFLAKEHSSTIFRRERSIRTLRVLIPSDRLFS